MSVPIITPQQMYAAEQRVFESGVNSFDLMRAAGEAVADQLQLVFPDGAVRVLCGPGGNGGDGFIAAARLAALGRDVQVFSLPPVERLTGDPARAAALWGGAVHPLDQALGSRASVTLDALFGGGLSRPLDGVSAKLAEQGAGAVVAVDVPSGLDGLTASPLGPCFRADLTVTFAALRPAHVLDPGHAYCGAVSVVDIGVPVPEAVRLVQLEPVLPEGVLSYGSEAELRAQIQEISGEPANLIELVRAVSRQSARPVFLAGDVWILASPYENTLVFREMQRAW